MAFGGMVFWLGQTVKISIFFPCNAIDLMLSFGEGQIMASEPLEGVMTPSLLDPPMAYGNGTDISK